MVLLADTGSGTDSLSIAATLALTDAGSGVDAVDTRGLVSLTDAGSGVDALTIAATLALADTGSGLDSIFVDKGYIYVTVNDTGSGSDAITKTLLGFELADTGTGVDSVSLVKRLTITDSGTGVDVVSAISQNSLQFGVTGFPSGQTVEYRIKDLNGTLVQDWTSTGVTEDLEITGKSTYTIKGIMLVNGFQGKVSWRIPSTTYYAVELINYYESFISAYAALPTLTEIEASTVLAKEASLTAIQGDVTRLLGLVLENHVEDDIVRDGSGNKTSSTIYCYDSAANAATHDGTTGLVAKYGMTAAYAAGKMSTFKVVKL